MRRATLVLLGFLVAACSGDGAARGGGSVVIAAFADADNLLPPFSRTLAAKAVTDVLFEKLAEIGPALNTVGDAGFEARLAQRWEWTRDSLAVTFHLDPRARWHDGHAVRASDVRFAFSVYTDTLVAANGGGELRLTLDSVSVGDSVTCTAWFRRRSPEQFYALVSNLVPLPEHLLASTPRDSLRTSAFSRQPVGNGPFRLVRWDAGQRIEVAAVDSFPRGRARLDRVIWSIAPEMATAGRQFMSGEADFIEALTPDAIAEVAKHPDLQAVRYGSFDYGFVRFNTHDGASERPHAILGDRAVRRALTMALDRPAMLRNVFDTLARSGIGPFVRAQWSSDTTLTALPSDRAAAARTLDSLGWRMGPDSVRAKGGRPLAFRLLVPSSSRSRGRFAVLIQEQLRQVGVQVNIESVDFGAFIASAQKRNFDALMDGSHANPSPAGIRQAWSTAGIGGGKGPNTGGYSNPVFDAHVDSALASHDVSVAKAQYRAAYQLIIDDAAAIWLFEPVAVAGLNKRLRSGPLRSDAWWLGLSTWSVASGGRRP